MGSLLKLDNCTIRFGGLTAVSAFCMEITNGELVGLIGPNGAGKTTVFNMVTGVYQPTEGEVLLAGERRHAHRPGTGEVDGELAVAGGALELGPRSTDIAVALVVGKRQLPQRLAQSQGGGVLAGRDRGALREQAALGEPGAEPVGVRDRVGCVLDVERVDEVDDQIEPVGGVLAIGA